jgi:hypothetical protein
LFLLPLIVIFCSGTSLGQALPQTQNEALNPQRVKGLCDSIIDDLLNDDSASLYRKMSADFRNHYGFKEFKGIMDQVYDLVGKPLEFVYDRVEDGIYAAAPGAEVRPCKKLLFATRTAKYAKDRCYMFIVVIPDGESISAAMVNFGLHEWFIPIPDKTPKDTQRT